jgi:hypothetical protein
MRPEVRRELERLLSALCDGQLGETQQTRLQELLDADAECRRLYLEYVDLHARLLVHPSFRGENPLPPLEGRSGDAADGPDTPSPPRETVRPAAGRDRWAPPVLRYALVAAATLAASLLLQVLWWHPQVHGPAPDVGPGAAAAGQPPGYVATLIQAAGCTWEDPGELRRAGSRLLPGELRLRHGIARIHFDSGPDLVLEGPAALRLESGNSATVLRGKLVFRGDETGAMFDLHTPSSTLLDLGTEYAVAVGPEGEEVHVFDGTVRRLPRSAPAGTGPEELKAGEARRYGTAPGAPGQPAALDPERFVRRLAETGQPPPDPAAGLLAYEGFDYRDPEAFQAGQANGGFGWTSPWTPGFARPLNAGDHNELVLNVRESLTRAGAAGPAAGGCFDYTGFAKYWRRLATPVRLDTDAVYYLSFLFRRQGPQGDPLNAVAVLLRTTAELQTEDASKRLNVGVGGANELFTHLHRVGSRTPLPLSYGQTYLLVAKIVAGGSDPDQVFMRVYGPDEPVERQEPGSWSVVGPPFQSDLVFDWLELHVNSKTRQSLDEVRLGTTWSSVTAPWARKDER